MSSNAFLERFQNKISTLTSNGALLRPDGTQEVLEGPRRRKEVITRTNSEKSKPKEVKKNGMQSKENHCRFGDQDNGRFNNVVQSHGTFRKSTTAQARMCEDHPSQGVHEKSIHPDLLSTSEGQLAYSKKARPVEYAPYSLNDYQREKPGTYYELGKLKPDLNSQELVEKRANQERIKLFSKNLREINKQQCSSIVQEKPKTRELSSRDKAIEFSKNIPKPKPNSKEHTKPLAPNQGKTVTITPSKDKSNTSKKNTVSNNSFTNIPTSTTTSELNELRMKHQIARAEVDAIRKEFGVF